MSWKSTKKLRGEELNKIQAHTFNPLDFAILGVLENKTNVTFHPNIGSLTTAIKEEWNKMSEEFILKACKSFRWHIYTIIEKYGGYMD